MTSTFLSLFNTPNEYYIMIHTYSYDYYAVCIYMYSMYMYIRNKVKKTKKSYDMICMISCHSLSRTYVVCDTHIIMISSSYIPQVIYILHRYTEYMTKCVVYVVCIYVRGQRRHT